MRSSGELELSKTLISCYVCTTSMKDRMPKEWVQERNLQKVVTWCMRSRASQDWHDAPVLVVSPTDFAEFSKGTQSVLPTLAERGPETSQFIRDRDDGISRCGSAGKCVA